MTMSGSTRGLAIVPAIIGLLLVIILPQWITPWIGITVAVLVGILGYLVVEYCVVRPFQEQLWGGSETDEEK